jgi:hypothetical protein
VAGLLVKEKDVGLHSGRVQDAGREPEESVDLALPEEPSSDRLTGASFEEDVVQDDDGAAAAHVEEGEDMLDEVELLVLGGGPEVLARTEIVAGRFRAGDAREVIAYDPGLSTAEVEAALRYEMPNAA